MRSPLDFTGITQKYSLTHRGLDMGHKKGENHPPVYSSADGICVYRAFQSKSGGWVLGIYHEKYDCTSEYGHLKEGSLKIKLGDRVKMGQLIANMGNTGKQNGKDLPIHLHYGICKGRGLNYGITHKWYNPTKYLNLYDGQTQGTKTLVKLNHTKKVKPKDGLNVRNQPSTNGKIVYVAKYNEQVECYEKKNGWELVDRFNKYYCDAKYLKK